MKRMNVLLDLDQTLISAEPLDDYKKYKDKMKDRSKLFRSETMEDYYIIFERPGLQSFLDYLFENFNVSVWTAASKDYALFIIDKFIINGKKNRKLDWIFFSYHCDASKKLKNGTKDLSMLWDYYNDSKYTPKNTVIIDDYSEVYNTQPGNCIIAVPFEFTEKESHKDTYLIDLKHELKKLKVRRRPSRKILKSMKLKPNTR